MSLQQVVQEYFLNRTDRLANLAPWGRPCPIDANGSLDQIIDAHLGKSSCDAVHIPSNGRKTTETVNRVGTYAPDVDGLTKWLCVDLDGKDHKAGLQDPLGVAEQMIETLGSLGFPSHLERSGGGRGFHVWMFFNEKIPAAEVRRLAFSVVPKDLRERARLGQGVEIFPKQDEIESDGVGNMVWLPWWAKAPQDCGEFYRHEPHGWFSYVPTSFEIASVDQILKYTSKLEKVEKKPAPPKPKAPANAKPSNDWATWRRDVTDALPLERVYGQWLTGKRGGKGWLMCRVPNAPNGDPHPSGGVADGTTAAERGTFKDMITGETIRVFDFMIKFGIARDISDANKMLADWTGIATPKTKPPKPPAPPKKKKNGGDDPKPKELPQIVVNGRQIRLIIKDAWAAILKTERPKIYVRNHELVRIRDGEHGRRIHPMTKDAVHGALLRCATWVKAKQGDGGSFFVDDKPNNEIALDMLAYPHPSLDRLEAVLHAPSFSAEGKLIEKAGYNEDSGIYYDELEKIPPVAKKPTSDQVLSARMLIEDDVFVDFPFTSRADKAAAWATLLVPFVRRMISGSTPLHLVEAPVAGSGKGLLADIACIAFMGREAEVTMLPTDEEETRKKVTSLLRAGRPVITFDNLPYGSKSAVLAAILTSRTWTDRKLGVQEMIEMSNRAIWITTVNNPDFNVDLARRCIRIRIVPDVVRPWERAEFKHKDLRGWCRSHRREIVHAILTIVQYWIAKGMPRSDRTLGSFEAWSRTMGGILDCVGVPGFLENAKDVYDESDTESAEWSEFVRCWWAVHESEPAAAKILVELAKRHELLTTIRGDRGPSSQSIRFGKALKRMRGRVVDGWRIDMRLNATSKSREYALEPITEEAKQPLYIADLHPDTAREIQSSWVDRY